MADIEEIFAAGEVRRLGSLCRPAGFVSAFAAFESAFPLLDDADIRKLMTDSNRPPRRAIFSAEWIQNQRSHGSCNGYAGAAALSRSRWLRGIYDNLILSGAYLYSKMNGGRDNGSMLDDGMHAVEKYGCAPELLVPWNQIYPRDQSPTADMEASKHKGLSCYAVESLQGLRSALALGFPCIVAVHAGGRFSTLNSGVCGVDSGSGNHAVMVDDLVVRGSEFLYDMANSWGLDFGEFGRGFLTEAHFAQTMKYHSFYAIPTTVESPVELTYPRRCSAAVRLASDCVLTA